MKNPKKFSANNFIFKSAIAFGLFFFAFNKILLNIFYAMRNTLAPALIGIVATLFNVGCNALLITVLKAPGLALATTLAGILQTVLMIYVLRRWYNYHGYIERFGSFAIRYILQLFVFCSAFLSMYFIIFTFLSYYKTTAIGNFFLNTIGFWMWAGPLCLVTVLLLYVWRNVFGVKLYFLD